MEQTITTMVSPIGTGLISALLGGWDKALEILLIVIALDYLTGVACAFKTQTLSSFIGYQGLLKKATIFIVVILAAQLDKMTVSSDHIFRNGTIFFFAANDALSILENAGRLGLRLPMFLKKALVKLRDSHDENVPKSPNDKSDT